MEEPGAPARGGRRRRAFVALSRAPKSPCPHCGRESKTVQGVCADCWQVKDPAVAGRHARPPRTSPLLDLDWSLSSLFELFESDPLTAFALVTLLLALVAGLVYAIATGTVF
jgi:hypothetical protein